MDNDTDIMTVDQTLADVTTPNAQYVLDIEAAANYVNAYVIIPIIIVGVFGNICTIYIFLKQKSWDKGSMDYFFALAVSDLGCLIIYGTVEWVSEGLKFATSGTFFYDMINQSAASCKSLRYAWNVLGFISAWLIVSVTAERFVATRFPLQSAKLLNSFRRKVVIVVVGVLGAIFYLPISVFVYDVMPIYPGATIYLCTVYHGGYEIVIVSAYFKLLVNYPLPVFIVIIFNVLIVWSLMRVRRDRKLARVRERTIVEHKVAKSLFIISAIFLVTMTPAAVTWLVYVHSYLIRPQDVALTAEEQNNKAMLLAMGKLANSMSMINYSVNFLVYCYSFDFYKNFLRNILCYCFVRQRTLADMSIDCPPELQKSTTSVSTVTSRYF